MHTFKIFLLWLGLALFILWLAFLGGLFNIQATIFKPEEDRLSRLFPPEQVLRGEESSLGGRLLTPFTQNIKLDENTGEIWIKTNSKDFEYNGHLDQSLQLFDSIFVFKSKEMIRFLGHDKRISRLNLKRKKLDVGYFLSGQEKGAKEFPYDQNTVDSDTLLIFLQGMLLKKVGNFKVDLIQKAKGLRVHAKFTLTVTDDLLKISPPYNFPELFRIRAKQLGDVNIYMMGLTGAAGLVYPYKYYFAYRKEPPYQLIAYWGGAPQEEEFGYILE